MIERKTNLVNVIQMSRQRCLYPIQGCLAYATEENFLGRVVDGYASKDAVLLTQTPAKQLCLVQNALFELGFGLFVFDAFRPLRAVRDFVRWSRLPISSSYEQERKKIHFPHLEKEDLFRLGYIADQVSAHCYGSAVDVSLLRLDTQSLVDMGTVFDFFGNASHGDAKEEEIGKGAVDHRRLLASTMQHFGFVLYPFEWWHFDCETRDVDQPMDVEVCLASVSIGG